MMGLAAFTVCGRPEKGVNSTALQFHASQYIAPNGEIWPYAVFVPARRQPSEKLPDILFLNGWGENGTDGLRQISNNLGGNLWRMREYFPFLAVCPQCSYNGTWTGGSPNATRVASP